MNSFQYILCLNFTHQTRITAQSNKVLFDISVEATNDLVSVKISIVRSRWCRCSRKLWSPGVENCQAAGPNLRGSGTTLEWFNISPYWFWKAVSSGRGVYGLEVKFCQWWDICVVSQSWWRHQMETFSALLACCAGNSPVTGEFPSQWPVTRSFDVFLDLCLI